MISLLILFPYFCGLILIPFTRSEWGFDKFYLLVLGLILFVLGGIIWLAAIFSLGKEYQLYRLPRKLITSGIYSKFRHPIYIGVEILFLGLAVFCSSFIGFVYVLIVLLPFQIARARWEEKLLIKKFGEDYLEYKTKTWF